MINNIEEILKDKIILSFLEFKMYILNKFRIPSSEYTPFDFMNRNELMVVNIGDKLSLKFENEKVFLILKESSYSISGDVLICYQYIDNDLKIKEVNADIINSNYKYIIKCLNEFDFKDLSKSYQKKF